MIESIMKIPQYGKHASPPVVIFITTSTASNDPPSDWTRRSLLSLDPDHIDGVQLSSLIDSDDIDDEIEEPINS